MQLVSPTDEPSEGLRNLHKQFIGKAFLALEEQSITERDITGRTFNISMEKIPLIKKKIQEFRNDIEALCTTAEAEETYQLNVQFFKLTEG